MPVIGTLTKSSVFRPPTTVYAQSAVLDAAAETTDSVAANRYGIVDVQFSTTGAATANITIIENSLDGGTTWVEVSTGTDRTANGSYKETFTGTLGLVRAKLKTLTGGTTPTVANLVISITDLTGIR